THPEMLPTSPNAGRAKKMDQREWLFRPCQLRDSKDPPLLQLVDILIGGIAYRLTGHDKALNAAPAKDELSSYILRCASVSDPFMDTPHAADFTIWHRRLRLKKVS